MDSTKIIEACNPIKLAMARMSELFFAMMELYVPDQNSIHYRTYISDNYTFFIDFKRKYGTVSSKSGSTIIKINREEDAQMSDLSNVTGIDRGDMVFISSTKNQYVGRGIRYKGAMFETIDNVDDLESFIFQMDIAHDDFPKDDMEVFIMEALLADEVHEDLYFGFAKDITSKNDLWEIVRSLNSVKPEHIQKDMKNNPQPD